MLLAVKKNGFIIEFASEELRNDKECTRKISLKF